MMETNDSPIDIARQTLKQLMLRKLAPTPDNFRRIYDEIAGTATADAPAEIARALAHVLQEVSRGRPKFHAASRNVATLIEERDWSGFEAQFLSLFPGAGADEPAPASLAGTEWRELLIRTLESGVVPQLAHMPEIAAQAQRLLAQAGEAGTETEVAGLTNALEAFWRSLKASGESRQSIDRDLMNLLRLLIDNIGDLVIDDAWLAGQTATIRDIVSNPLSAGVLHDAEIGLQDLILQQRVLKQGLLEARGTVKDMASSFIRRLADMTESTGEYHRSVEGYSQEISSTEDVTELNRILDKLMTDTRNMQLDAKNSHEELKATEVRVAQAEQRIRELTTELQRISEVAHEDFLTGALNRRGLDQAMEREFSRADRQDSAVCVAMMDIDHFKTLNDRLGHDTGDRALVYLSQLTRAALRPSDMLARYGGEEFVIILPDTGRDEAVQVLTRVQRELTKELFLHNNEKVLITFSAGVAQRQPGEHPDAALKRADLALYDAKHTGRNRVTASD